MPKLRLITIVYRPKVLILDEPFSGLDPLVRDEFIQGILEIADGEGWTIFLASHDIEEVERLADTIGILNKGKLHLSEPIDELVGRFRRIEVTKASIPENPPKSWLQIKGDQANAKGFAFAESQWQDDKAFQKTATEILGPGANWTASALNLREVFLVLAREFRIAG